MKTHELKTWLGHFHDVDRGVKKFELRRDDRGFEVGDLLVLCEWNQHHSTYTGRKCYAIITSTLRCTVGDPVTFGLKEGHVILSIKKIKVLP